MGLLLQAQGKLAEAEPYCREALESRRRVLGDEHADTLISINNMGFLLQAQGKLAEAEPYCREALGGCRRVLGDDHRITLMSISTMGSLLHAQGKPVDAIALLEPAELAARRAFTAANAARLGQFLTLLGRCCSATGAFETAETNLTEAYAILSAGPNAPPKSRKDVLTGLAEPLRVLARRRAGPGSRPAGRRVAGEAERMAGFDAAGAAAHYRDQRAH